MKLGKSERKSGLAKVELHPKQPKVKVTLKGEEEAEPQVFILNKENCPAYVRNGNFLVDLNSDGTKMTAMRPEKGIYELKVKSFMAKEKEEPTPKTKRAAKGDFTYQVFFVNFEIQKGPNKGMVIPGSLPYNFQEGREEVPGKGIVSVAEISHVKSQFTKNLVDFLEVTNVMKKTIPWKENLLPLLQKYVLKEDKTFSGSVKNGWIDALFESGEAEAEEE